MATITIDKKNFYHNLTLLSNKCGGVEKLALVLKDNAYGHGLTLMASLASEFGVTKAVVRDVGEAEQIKAWFDEVIVLGGAFVLDTKFSFVVNALSQLHSVPQELHIELKVDTGMGRNGIAMHEIEEALAMIEKRKLTLRSVMTHYACADELGSELFFQQKNFEKVKSIVRKVHKEVRFHSSNSATLLRMQAFNESLVRVGIAAYGYNEMPTLFGTFPLKPVLKLYAQKVSTRVLEKGDRVGYGGEFVATHTMKVSTYNLGYGDGWRRGDVGNPYTTAEKLPLLGRVSMDFISIEGDKEEVCMMDDALRTARHFGTISYEVLTSLNANIVREVI
jgi:alanine racemase